MRMSGLRREEAQWRSPDEGLLFFEAPAAALRSKRIQNPQRLYAEHPPNFGGEDIVRPAWRHAEPDRNDLAPATPLGSDGGNKCVGPYPPWA